MPAMPPNPPLPPLSAIALPQHKAAKALGVSKNTGFLGVSSMNDGRRCGKKNEARATISASAGLLSTAPYTEAAMSEETVPSRPAPDNCVTYFIQAVTGGAIKIGKTVDVQLRLKSLQTSSPTKLVCLGQIDGDCEENLHERFHADRLNGEWFRPTAALCRYIEQHAKVAELPQPGRMSRDVERELLTGKWVRECEGKWIDGDENFEEQVGNLPDFPADTCPREVEPEPDAIEPDEDRESDCECDQCTWLYLAVPTLAALEPMGAVWREWDSMLCVYMPRPYGEVAREELKDRLAFIMDDMDSVGVSLNAMFVDGNGQTEDMELFGYAHTVLFPKLRERSGRPW